MKTEVLLKAMALDKRIERLSQPFPVSMSTSNCTASPFAREREYSVGLNDDDAEELKKIIERYCKNKLARLQKEFDNLK
jgi:L-2-hydroxyglutarate oxidase LhgO